MTGVQTCVLPICFPVTIREIDFLITPRDVARWDILPEDIVQIKNGMAEAGKTPSRSVALHHRIYQLNPHINSIITTQSTNLMAHAVSHQKFDVRTIPESWIFLQDVPSIPFETLHNSAEEIAQMFSKNRVVIVENDSVIVTGNKLINTFDYLEVAEFSANSLVMASSVGGMLSSFTDSPGKIVTINNDKFKEFYGSASAKQSNKTSRIEGTVILNKLKNSDMLSYMEYLSECLQSSISYAGGVNIDSLHSVRWI